MSNYLSEDLLIDVLSRLPVKSLLRFKCVSKRWRSLIEGPEFIQKHLDKSSMRIFIGSYGKAEYSDGGLAKRYCLFSAEEYGSRESFLRTRKEVCNPLQDFPHRFDDLEITERIKVVGSCNGLVCVQYSRYDVLVWNPWMRKYWIIPPTPVDVELYPGRIFTWDRFTYGFGYDDSNDDYKLVRIVLLEDKNSKLIEVEVKVFSMKSNLWRRIPQDFSSLETVCFCGDGCVLANGALHWMLLNYKPGLNYKPSFFFILAINLATEEHRLLPTPEPARCCRLSGFSGKVYCFTEKLWVLGEDDSWRVIDMGCSYKMAPIAYSANEKSLIFHTGDKLVWFNKKTLVGSNAPHGGGSRDDIFCGVASLVEPNRKGIKCRKKYLKRCFSEAFLRFAKYTIEY